jgi:hypothetical protein
MAAAETVDNGVPDNPTALLNYVRMDLDAGDNPPDIDQATIVDATNTEKPGKPEPIVREGLHRYLVITDVFSLDVPPAQPGSKLLRTCFDVPINVTGIENEKLMMAKKVARVGTGNPIKKIVNKLKEDEEISPNDNAIIEELLAFPTNGRK